MRLRDLPAALDRWEEITARIRGRRPVVFLDYDGTLTPIVDRPEDALLPDATRRTIEQLRQHCPVAVISGRDLEDVAARVGIGGIAYAGSHGFDIQTPEGDRTGRDESLVPVIAQAAAAVAEALEEVDGVVVESKRYAVSVHLRRVDPSVVDDIEEAVRDTVRQFEGLRVTHGKQIFEIRPDLDWDKGQALEHLLAMVALDPARVAPVYIGDDITDEDAFRVVEDRGLGLVVLGEGDDRSTRAHYALRNPGETRIVLARLAELAQG